VPEQVTAAEVAHHGLGHRTEAATGRRMREEIVEILEAVLLSIVAVATAWSGYQAARWDGRQAHLYGLTSKFRLVETQATTRSGQEKIYDTTTFGFWLQERSTGHLKNAALFERRFRPEYRVAFAAWLKTDPFHNSKAPAGPIFMPQYRNAAAERAARFDRKAAAAFETGTRSRENGDRYLRNTVLLATVLFLTAVAQRFKIPGVRLGLMGVSAILLAVALYFVVTYPVA
jgi:hypothetical protein